METAWDRDGSQRWSGRFEDGTEYTSRFTEQQMVDSYDDSVIRCYVNTRREQREAFDSIMGSI